jgi:hypothetical protein
VTTPDPAHVLRTAADFLTRVRGDEYSTEYIQGYDDAVDLIRGLADHHDAKAAREAVPRPGDPAPGGAS